MTQSDAIVTAGLEGADAAGEEVLAKVVVFRMTLRLAQRLRYLMDQRLQPAGLTNQQAMLLFIIQSRGTPSFSESAAALGVSHQNIKQLATSLERKGFLRIVPDERDARVKRLVVTPQHLDFWEQRNQDDFDAVSEWLAELSLPEARHLGELLDKAFQSAAGTTRARLPERRPQAAKAPARKRRAAG